MPGTALAALKSIASSLGKRPLRLVLQIVSTAVGAGALALALGVSSRLDGFLRDLDQGGRRIVIANASASEATQANGQGGVSWQMPPVFNADEPAAFKAAASGLREVSIVNNLNWDRIQVEGKAWSVRRALAADEGYASVMGLDVVAGAFFSAAEVKAKDKVVVISKAAADRLFGGPQAAVGKTIMADRGIRVARDVFRAPAASSSPGGNTSQAGGAFSSARAAASGLGANAGPQAAMDSYKVVGVFADPDSFTRDAYGIPEMVIPWTAQLPSGFSGATMVRTLVARADARAIEGISAELRMDAVNRHGEGTKLMVWEGDASRPQADVLGRARSALADFSALAQSLGGLILAIACFGIASGIAVEAADRSREIAIRRAVGLTTFKSAVAFTVDGTVTAAIGALIGLGAAAAFFGPVGQALDPYLQALGVSFGSTGGSLPARAFLAPLLAVAAAFFFSLAPAMRASSGAIADSLKE